MSTGSPQTGGRGDRTFTLMVGETRANSSLCIRKRKPEQVPVPPDRMMWPKRIFQRAELQELMLWKAFMWMPRPFLPVGGAEGHRGLGARRSADRTLGLFPPCPRLWGGADGAPSAVGRHRHRRPRALTDLNKAMCGTAPHNHGTQQLTAE